MVHYRQYYRQSELQCCIAGQINIILAHTQARSRIVKTCFISCRQSINAGACDHGDIVEQRTQTALSALN